MYAITYDKRNISVSMIISIIFHLLLYASFLHLKGIQNENMILLEDIEFIEIEADVPIHDVLEIPAQAPPKNVLDFIKMAFLPQKEEGLREIAEPDMEQKIDINQSQKIDLDKRVDLESRPEINLDQKDRYTPETQLSEIVPDTETQGKSAGQLSLQSPDEPEIDISEVGKVAVQSPDAGKPINLAKKSPSASFKDIKNIEIESPKKVSGTSQLKESSISLGKKGPVTGKSTMGYTKRRSIGYSKGVTLKKLKKAEVQDLNVITPVAKKSYTTSEGTVKEAKVSKKSVEIAGPVSERKIVKSYLPVYPDWARAKNIEANVVIKFFVTPEGLIRDKVFVERTSGYSKLDRLAVEAIKKWVFNPIEKNKGDQWGFVTFKYILQ
ncbi:MAG: energy transducer TonB [Endomicrobiales bacterium]|nr:energy transducer TonB [Endomicrobiales bacterium]